jgi:CheY-like chemotaxis protein
MARPKSPRESRSTADAAPRGRARDRGHVSTADGPRKRGPDLVLDVLLVDDDPVVRKNYGAELRAAGWRVTVAADGDEALRAADGRSFDVVLLDLRMPDLAGPDLLRALRARPRTAAAEVFVLAQSGDADLVELAMRDGAQGVFEKSRATPSDVVIELAGRFLSRAGAPSRARVVRPPTPTVEVLDAPPLPVARRAATVAGPGSRAVAPCAPTVVDETRPSPARRTPAQFANPARDRYREAPTADAAVVEDAPSFNTMLSRYVGETANLASALGLSKDLACAVCCAPLALRLSPDGAVPFGVRGRFYCPHCDRL